MDVACGGHVPEGFGDPKPQFDGPENVLGDDPRPTARMRTSCGEVTIELLADHAPTAVNSFAFLASQGFYEATPVHRVVPGFVVQMGDPTGTGTGGPGYRFDDELEAARDMGYARGTVAMANAGPNTNGSQFFVCLADVPLPPDYTVFGVVTDGMDAMDRIAQIPVSGEKPQQAVFLESVQVR